MQEKINIVYIIDIEIQRGIQDSGKHLKWSVFQKKLTCFTIIVAKDSISDVCESLEYASEIMLLNKPETEN